MSQENNQKTGDLKASAAKGAEEAAQVSQKFQDVSDILAQNDQPEEEPLRIDPNKTPTERLSEFLQVDQRIINAADFDDNYLTALYDHVYPAKDALTMTTFLCRFGASTTLLAGAAGFAYSATFLPLAVGAAFLTIGAQFLKSRAQARLTDVFNEVHKSATFNAIVWPNLTKEEQAKIIADYEAAKKALGKNAVSPDAPKP